MKKQKKDLAVIHIFKLGWYAHGDLKGKGLFEYYMLEAFKLTKYKVQYQIKINNLYSVDFLLNEKIVFNVNGPSHYLVANRYQLNKKTLIKNRVLRNKGYYVIDFHLMSFTNSMIKQDIPTIKSYLERFISEEIKRQNINL